MAAAIVFTKGDRIPDTRLTYLEEAERRNPKRREALFKCDCGNTIKADLNWVRFGNITSCGCYRSELVTQKNTKHSHAPRNDPSGAYRSWKAMHQRVKSNPHYAHVRVCLRWSGDPGFENFLSDMGERPDDQTIERRDNAKGYEPGNCMWATRLEQAQNQRHTQSVTIGSETHSIQEWCRRKGIMYSLIKQRRRRGISLVDAITTPVDVSKQGGKRLGNSSGN